MRESYCPFFDADDTLIMGSTPMMNWCYKKGLEAVGINLDERKLRNATDTRWGATHQEQFTFILKGDQARVKVASDFYWHEFETTFIESVGFLPGTAEALGRLAVKPALVTGNHPDILPSIFKKIGIDMDFFDPVVTSYDIPHEYTKPNPFMVYEAIRRRKKKDTFSPHEVVVIGDSLNDMLMANRAGAKSIAVLTGRMTRATAEELQKADSSPNIKIDAIANDIIEVPEKIALLD